MQNQMMMQAQTAWRDAVNRWLQAILSDDNCCCQETATIDNEATTATIKIEASHVVFSMKLPSHTEDGGWKLLGDLKDCLAKDAMQQLKDAFTPQLLQDGNALSYANHKMMMIHLPAKDHFLLFELLCVTYTRIQDKQICMTVNLKVQSSKEAGVHAFLDRLLRERWCEYKYESVQLRSEKQQTEDVPFLDVLNKLSQALP